MFDRHYYLLIAAMQRRTMGKIILSTEKHNLGKLHEEPIPAYKLKVPKRQNIEKESFFETPQGYASLTNSLFIPMHYLSTGSLPCRQSPPCEYPMPRIQSILFHI